MTLAIRLNKRVLLQKTGGQDASGQPRKTWDNLVTTGDGKVWAEVLDVSPREYLSADQVQSEVQTRITIRTGPPVKLGMRALVGDTVYTIKTPLNRADGTTQLMCKKEL